MMIILLVVSSFLFCVCVFSSEKKIVYPEITDDVLFNPMTGYAPWAYFDDEGIDKNYSLVYADLTWREWEPKPGTFDFESFEKRVNLHKWRSEGKRVVFRFVCDVPGDEEHMDIPDWLYEMIGGRGDWYDTSYGKGFSPDYSNSVLISRHEMALKALGERYGKDDFFCFVELGSIGHWGEWHVKYPEDIRRIPGAPIREQYVLHYMKSFPNTHLLMRRPFAIAVQKGLGLYNDMTSDPESTEEWLDWIEHGGEYEQASEGMGALRSMPDGWKTAPVGGELTGNLSFREMLVDQLSITADLLKRSHTTFIGPKSPVEMDDCAECLEGSQEILKTIGYRFRIEKAIFTKSRLFKDHLEVSLDWVNDGIAPFYYSWDVFLYVISNEGNTVIKQKIELDIKDVIPEITVTTKTDMDLSSLRKGDYQIGIAIIDPLTEKPGIAFAMENTRDDRITILGAYEKK